MREAAGKIAIARRSIVGGARRISATIADNLRASFRRVMAAVCEVAWRNHFGSSHSGEARKYGAERETNTQRQRADRSEARAGGENEASASHILTVVPRMACNEIGAHRRGKRLLFK